MLTMKDDFKILTFVSFCKQCFLVFIRKDINKMDKAQAISRSMKVQSQPAISAT